MTPSKEWREEIAPDEEARFGEFADELAAMQQRRTAKYGAGRALHRKQVLALRAKLEVLGNLPEHARHGLFARPGEYDARIRFSNGSMDVVSDRKPDIRGYAIKVLGVNGPGALGQATETQDFVMINRRVFGFRKPDLLLRKPLFQLNQYAEDTIVLDQQDRNPYIHAETRHNFADSDNPIACDRNDRSGIVLVEENEDQSDQNHKSHQRQQ